MPSCSHLRNNAVNIAMRGMHPVHAGSLPCIQTLFRSCNVKAFGQRDPVGACTSVTRPQQMQAIVAISDFRKTLQHSLSVKVAEQENFLVSGRHTGAAKGLQRS